MLSDASTRRFRAFNADAYYLFNPFSGYSVACFNIFMHRFQVFHYGHPCSVMFACWLPVQGQVVAMVARPASATVWPCTRLWLSVVCTVLFSCDLSLSGAPDSLRGFRQGSVVTN